ncbi:MAG: iron chaperone [Anaerorhabdus sp.]
MKKDKAVEVYLRDFPDYAHVVEEIRNRIEKIQPETVEKLSWGMPTYHWHENVIHVAFHKKHVGIYPGAAAVEEFTPIFEKKGYSYSKGAVQFPYSGKVDYPLIDKMIKFQLKEIMGRLK